MTNPVNEELQRPSDQRVPGEYVEVDPLQHAEWDRLVAAFPEATVFHGAGWARVLRETYGHHPIYICRFEGEHLREVLPIMEIVNRWSGRRGVSLPFTDFCSALQPAGGDAHALYQRAMEKGRGREWKYLECRGGADWKGASPSVSFYGHAVDLSPNPDELFACLDSAMRRGVRKAEAAGIKVDFKEDPESIKTFYGLHCRTRRRHGLPPQPFRFFENIQRYILAAGQGFVATARLKEQPVAAAIFFSRGRRALYKFGASDFAFQHLRPNNLTLWAGIKHAASQGCATVHLGRTSLTNEGLRRFKLAFGAKEETMRYYRYDFASRGFVSTVDRAAGWFNHLFRHMPLPLLRVAGQILYPHLS